MPSSTLTIDGRVVSHAEGGVFDAEYALFDAHEIDLRSQNEPGTVREHGYTTTADLARERLDAEGVTKALVDAAAIALAPLVAVYARGAEVRRVAALLGPAELLEGRVYEARARSYEGRWLDLAALAADLETEGAARALQAIHLAALLHDALPKAPVVMATHEHMKDRRVGERSFRRVSLDGAARVVDAIRALAERGARGAREEGPARAELLEEVRARRAACASPEPRARLEALERALSARERPARGPLSDPELWVLEAQMDEGSAAGVAERLDAIERARGREPATAYLRARAALAAGEEDPRALADRVSAMAMAMSSFAELELLAAEAWVRAGDRRRAQAYARDLAENPHVESAIRDRAREIAFASAEPGAPPRAPGPASDAPPIQPTAIVSVAPPGPRPVAEQGPRSSPSGLVAAARAAQDAALGPPSASELSIPRPPASGARLSQRMPAAPPAPSSAASVRPVRSPPSEPDPTAMKGASLPPFRSEPPPPTFPAAPLVPRLERVELAETLSLPASLPPVPTSDGARPTNPAEARFYFTTLARELGRLYRQRLGVELRLDLRGLEIVQRELAERFTDRDALGPDDADEVRRSGAFVSELLARRLGAEWTDLSPADIGHWAMSIPPGTTVWPVGRVVRFTELRHRERDLTSYVLELEARARGLW